MKRLLGPAAPRGGLLGGGGGGGRPWGRSPRAVLALSAALNLAFFAGLAVLLLQSGPGGGPASAGENAGAVAAQLSRTQALLASVQEQTQALTTQVAGTRASLQQQQRGGGGAAAAAGAGAAPLLGDGRRWLTIGIPTVPRRGAGGANATAYLTATLESLMEELPADPSGARLRGLRRAQPY